MHSRKQAQIFPIKISYFIPVFRINKEEHFTKLLLFIILQIEFISIKIF